jgi:site-specific DNA recombinase
MTIKAAIYLRVSTDEQVAGYGLDVQLTKCEALATVKGWVPACVFADEGISGTKDAAARPGLAAMLEAVDAGEVTAVIVYALDRLARSTRLVLEYVDRFTRQGAAIVSCKESLDTSTPAGQFVLTMFAALAQLERDTIVARTTDGRNERGRRDGERGGRVPMGYARIMGAAGATGEIAVVDHEATIVRRIVAQRATGATLAAIADDLNSDGATTRRGGRWHASSVREVLLNEADYRGGRRGASGVCWPAILA